MDRRSILITGCSSGIGYASALFLKERGWRVFATARRLLDVEHLKSEGFEATLLDLADADSIKIAVAWVLRQTGGTLDAVFHNGSFAVPMAVEDLPSEALRYQFETGFFGWHELNRLILPIMRKQGYGRIIYNSSVLGMVAMSNRGAYVANKFALEGLTDCLRLELANTNIKVSLIEPGPITSSFRKNAYLNFLHFAQNFKESAYLGSYQTMINRFESGIPEPFTLPPEAVAEKLLHALESKNPKPRYFVTRATWILTTLKRFLPTKLMDKLILNLAKKEARRYQQYQPKQ